MPPKKRIDHDAAYKRIFSFPKVVESLLRDFFPALAENLDFSTLQNITHEFVGRCLRKRRADCVWSVQVKDRPDIKVAFLLEFQRKCWNWMPLRTLEYIAMMQKIMVNILKLTKNSGLPEAVPISFTTAPGSGKYLGSTRNFLPPSRKDLPGAVLTTDTFCWTKVMCPWNPLKTKTASSPSS